MVTYLTTSKDGDLLKKLLALYVESIHLYNLGTNLADSVSQEIKQEINITGMLSCLFYVSIVLEDLIHDIEPKISKDDLADNLAILDLELGYESYDLPIDNIDVWHEKVCIFMKLNFNY